MKGGSEHLVHFFDHDRARRHAVSGFVAGALARNQSVLVVARSRHWESIAARLRRQGAIVGPLDSRARLVVLDADVVLAGLMSRGRFDPECFRRTIAPLVRDLADATPHGLSAYVELADILAAERNLAAVEHLEACWNELAGATPLTLLCGYASAHFTAPAMNRSIGVICRAHGCVYTDGPDGLGRWLVGSSTTSFSAAPGEL